MRKTSVPEALKNHRLRRVENQVRFPHLPGRVVARLGRCGLQVAWRHAAGNPALQQRTVGVAEAAHIGEIAVARLRQPGRHEARLGDGKNLRSPAARIGKGQKAEGPRSTGMVAGGAVRVKERCDVVAPGLGGGLLHGRRARRGRGHGRHGPQQAVRRRRHTATPALERQPIWEEFSFLQKHDGAADGRPSGLRNRFASQHRGDCCLQVMVLRLGALLAERDIAVVDAAVVHLAQRVVRHEENRCLGRDGCLRQA